MFKANTVVNVSIYDDTLLTCFTMMPVATLPVKSMLQFLLCWGSSNSTTDWMQVMMRDKSINGKDEMIVNLLKSSQPRHLNALE